MKLVKERVFFVLLISLCLVTLASSTLWFGNGGLNHINVTLGDGIDKYVIAGQDIYLYGTASNNESGILNISLWTNSTGTWKLNKTNSLGQVSNLSENYKVNDDHSTDCKNNQWCAQTFRLGISATNKSINISKVGIHLDRSSNTATKLLLSIRLMDSAGKPTGNNIATNTTVSLSELPDNAAGQWFNFTLNQTTQLLKNQSYALVLTTASGDEFFWRDDSSSPAYGGGSVVISTDGTTWGAPTTGSDFLFEIYEEPYYNTVYTANYSIPLTAKTLWNINAYDPEKDNGWGALNKTWQYWVLQNSHSYNQTVTELSSESFILNITLNRDIFSSISATLNYNGTTYSPSKSNIGKNTIFSKTIDIPKLDSQENRTFYWDLSLTNLTGTFLLNSSIYYQNVSPTIFHLCDATYTNSVVNFSIFDEATPTNEIVSDFKGSFEWYFGGAGSVRKNYSIEIVSNKSFAFCTDPNANYTVDSKIHISSDGYEERTFEFIGKVYNPDTTNVSLYLLNSTLSSNIIIEVKDTGLSPLKDYLVEIYRFYPEDNNYKLVESKTTDLFGQITSKLVENDVKYKIMIYNNNNNLVKETGDISIACRSSICVIPFVIEDTTDDFDRFENITSYEYSLNFDNATKIFTFTWNDNTGNSPTHRLEVKRRLFNGTTTVCDTSSTALAGSLTCAVGDSTASYQAQAFRTVDSIERRIAVVNIKVGSAAQIFGREGLFWSFILLFTLIIVGMFSPVVGITLYLVGLAFLGFSNIVQLDPAVLIAQVIIGGLFIWAFRS